MYKKKSIIGFIPARGGSKSIPHKNILPISGKPLIWWTIEAAVASQYLDHILVSTDSENIRSSALCCGETNGFPVEVIDRPAELASDTSKTIDAVLHTLDTLKSQGRFYDYLMILQPTSPLRTTADIDGCIQQAIDQNQNGVVSVHRINQYPHFMRYMPDQENKMLQNVLRSSSTIRRQDIPPLYYVNGALYLYRVDLLTPQVSLNDAPYGFVIDFQHALDINTLEDIETHQESLSKIKRS